jgi:hypothetical protein
VAEAPPAMRRAERLGALREGAASYASLGVTLGVVLDEASQELGRAWAEMTGGKKGGQP